MSAKGSFDFRTLGKADYSQAAALVASLPADVRSEIKGVSDEILRRLVHVMWYRAEHSGRGVAYCTPALRKLSQWASRSVRTVQRHLSELAASGLLSIKRRSTHTGDWTSNLYTAGPRLLASLFARKSKKSPIKPDMTKTSHDNLKRVYKAAPESATGERLTDLVLKLRANRQAALGGQLVGSADDSW